MSPRLTSLLVLLGEKRFRQPKAVYKYWAGGLRSCDYALQVPAVLRVRHPSDSIHRQSVGHSCYATETGIRSATLQVAGSVHSCFLADEVAVALVVDIGSCSFTAGFAGDHAIRAVFHMIGGMIFGIMVDMDQKVCVCPRSSFVFQRNGWFDSGYICRAPRRVGSGMVFAGLLVTMISRCVHFVVGRPVESSQVQSLRQFQLLALPAGMWGSFLGALCIGTGLGVMSTGT